MPKMVFWVTEVGEKDNEIVGKKSANLGQMAKLGLQVPPCFFVSIAAYDRFMSETGLGGEIRRCISGFGDLEKVGIKNLEKMSEEIKQLIKSKELSSDLKEQIGSSYRSLCKKVGEDDLAVSVRSSGTVSRPGMFATYFNVKGEKDVLETTKDVWASAFTTRALAFRINKQLPIDGDSLGVAVVKMVEAKAAGVSFSVDPIKGDPSRIVIEATWGLGEGVVKGTESVDRFLVDKETLETEKQIGRKEKQVVVCSQDGIRWEDVPQEKKGIPCLNDDEIKQVAILTKFLEEKLGQPQDVEWAIEQGSALPANVYLLQTRPAKIAIGKKSSISEQLCEDVTKTFRKIDISKLRMPGADFKV